VSRAQGRCELQEELGKDSADRDVPRMIRVLEELGVRAEAEEEVARHDAIALRELDAIAVPEERKAPLRALADLLMVRTH
jgi:geranylgeranyl pyrophosphate synthase